MARNSGLLLLVLGAGALGAALYFGRKSLEEGRRQKQIATQPIAPAGSGGGGFPIAPAGSGGGGFPSFGGGGVTGGFDPYAVQQIQQIVNRARQTSESQGGLDRCQRLRTAIEVLKAAAQGVQDPARKDSIMAKVAELEAQAVGC